jgi:molecular chaperone GrpE
VSEAGEAEVDVDTMPEEPVPGEADSAKQEADSAKQIEELRAQYGREHDLFLRTLADFENYRRRIERQQTEANRNGKRQILFSLLEVLDGFERAFRQIAALSEPEQEGLRHLYKQLSNVMTAEGVRPFDSLGRVFDPNLHEAVATVSKEGPSGLVAEEHQRGYRWHDELLRPAQVTVTQ